MLYDAYGNDDNGLAVTIRISHMEVLNRHDNCRHWHFLYPPMGRLDFLHLFKLSLVLVSLLSYISVEKHKRRKRTLT